MELDLVAITDPSSTAGVVSASSTVPSLPGADTTTTYNRVVQPVGSLNTTITQTIRLYMTYHTTGGGGCASGCTGNGVQLRWLRIEAIN